MTGQQLNNMRNQAVNMQRLVRNFSVEQGLCLSPSIALLDLISELGEVSQEISVRGEDPRSDNGSSNHASILDEFGDVVYSFISVVNSFDLQLEDPSHAESTESLTPLSALTRVVTQVGLLSKQVLQGSNYGAKELEVDRRTANKLAKGSYESLLSLGISLGIDPYHALEGSIHKYRQRADNFGTVGSSGDKGITSTPLNTSLTSKSTLVLRSQRGNDVQLEDVKMFVADLTTLSGPIISQYFQRSLAVELKDDQTPVTIADRKVEEVIRKCIRDRFPDHGIIGEEYGSENEEATFVWVIDPIDGTKSFISGAFDFGTVIALLKDGEPIIGVVNLV